MLFFSVGLLTCSVFLLFFFSWESPLWVFEWVCLESLGGVLLSGVFIVDFFSKTFVCVVLFISAMIFMFAKYYMDTDFFQWGFSVLLFFFVGSMLLLILSPNLVMLLLGWDGLGLTSYLLVVYYMGVSSSVAGMVTFLVNRLGDVFFLLSISFLFFLGDWDFYSYKFSIGILSILLVMAFVTKSAQIPFSSWLPAAMAAPTPVSALVHSSTLVTAGVFLLIRFYVLVIPFCFFLCLVSLFTLGMAGLMANYEWDMKKMIALSTLSQLGFMVFTFSIGLILFSFFHLVIHALFKASLFMSSGVVIHSGDNSQEFRNLVGVSQVKPLVSVAVMVCLFCLCGVPFSSGFFSKDLILDGGLFSFFLFFFFLGFVLLTISYSLRFSWYLLNTYLSSRASSLYVYENVYFVLFPIWALIALAVGAGLFIFELFFCLGLMTMGGFWKSFYFLFFFFFFFLTLFNFRYFFSWHSKQYFFSNMWFLSKLVGWRMGYGAFGMGRIFLGVVDQGVMEQLGPQGGYWFLSSWGSFFSRQVNYGLYLFFLGFFLFVFFLG